MKKSPKGVVQGMGWMPVSTTMRSLLLPGSPSRSLNQLRAGCFSARPRQQHPITPCSPPRIYPLHAHAQAGQSADETRAVLSWTGGRHKGCEWERSDRLSESSPQRGSFCPCTCARELQVLFVKACSNVIESLQKTANGNPCYMCGSQNEIVLMRTCKVAGKVTREALAALSWRVPRLR